eukprot:9571632-Alexandrium_andersonii.AAC.1
MDKALRANFANVVQLKVHLHQDRWTWTICKMVSEVPQIVEHWQGAQCHLLRGVLSSESWRLDQISGQCMAHVMEVI